MNRIFIWTVLHLCIVVHVCVCVLVMRAHIQVDVFVPPFI